MSRMARTAGVVRLVQRELDKCSSNVGTCPLAITSMRTVSCASCQERVLPPSFHFYRQVFSSSALFSGQIEKQSTQLSQNSYKSLLNIERQNVVAKCCPSNLSLAGLRTKHSPIPRHKSNILKQRWMNQIPWGFPPVTLVMGRGVSGSAADSNGGDSGLPNSRAGDVTQDSGIHSADIGDWAETTVSSLKDSVSAVTTGVRDSVEMASPLVNKYLSNPYVMEIVLPIGVYVGAWLVLPRLLRRLHKYVEQGSATLLQGSFPATRGAPYELSLWGALEDPARLFATLLALSQLAALVAPNTVAAHYLAQVWNGGSAITLVWFLHRWKSNVFIRLLSGKKLTGQDRERYLALDKISSIGLIFIGGLAIAEASGVAVQSLLTVGGIGGVATAFAARDVLGNLLSGMALFFSKPFSVGDTISAGSVEGKVEDMGLHSTRLLNSEKNPVIVPNSFFSSQVIVNKSRAPLRGVTLKIPIRLQDFEKIPVITTDVNKMLRSHSRVHMDEELPRCFLSRFSLTASELVVSCNLQPMSKDEIVMVEQEILLETARIVIKAGATLGGP